MFLFESFFFVINMQYSNASSTDSERAYRKLYLRIVRAEKMI